MRQFVSTFIRNTVLVNVLLIMIIGLGGVAATSMIKELFPEISVDVLMVTMAYPGADPEEVEEGISRKIEEAIDGLEGIKQYTTVSSESFARAAIEVREDYSVDQAYTDVRNAIDSISTFPVDAEKPIIAEATIKDAVISLALWGDQPERTLKEFAEVIKDEIQSLPNTSQVNIFGTRDYEIAIEVSEERLREYDLTFEQVSQAVRRGSMNLSGGVVRTKGEEIRLRTIGRAYTGEEFADIVVLARPDGEIITLDRIAEIKDAFVEDPVIARFNGEPAVMLGVYKTPSEDILAIVDEVRDYVDRKQKELPDGVNATLWSDRSDFIRDRISLLMRNGFIGLSIVFLSLWLFLDLRLSFWVTMGIPVSLSGGLLLMWLIGATLNEISLFGLIMVLGIVVDDAIIVGEAIYVHRKNGDGPLAAATNGVMEVGLPVLAAVTTSIIAFSPLLFVDGVMGKFVGIIPVAVITALSVSLVESLFLLPAHLNHLPDLNEKKNLSPIMRFRSRFSDGLEWFVHHVYKPFISLALRYRYIAVSTGIFILMLTGGLVGGGFVKFTVMPDGDSYYVLSQIEFPRGTPINVTEEAVRQTEEALHRALDTTTARDGSPVVRNVFSVAGESGGDSFERSPGSHLGNISVELVEGPKRDMTASEILVAWENEVGTIPGVISHTFTGLEGGPPGAPIEVRLRGTDLPTLQAVADELKNELRTYDGVYQVSDTFRPGKNEMRLNLKPEARGLGLQLDDLARQVYAGFYGEEALRIQRGRDDIRVKIRYTEDERSTLADLEQVRIRTPAGHEVPLFSVANVDFAQGYANITRVDGSKTISVTAENDPQRANADQVLAELAENTLPELEAKYGGFSWSFEGAQKQSRDAIGGLLSSFPLAMLGIFLVIAAIFRSYVQPVVIMLAVPFGVIGAVFGHLLLGIDLAMFSIFGMVALTGVVVNDAIVLIEAVNANLAKGMPVFQAISEGGARRFRAIMLTTVSTVGGLAPLISETDAGAQVIVPMALSLASGVAFATVVTLVFIPCMLAVLNDLRRAAYWVIFHRLPTREEVEPARTRYHDPEEASPSPTVGDPIIAK